MDLMSMLSSLQGLSEQYVAKKEEASLMQQPEEKVRTQHWSPRTAAPGVTGASDVPVALTCSLCDQMKLLWGDYNEMSETLKAVLVSERDRQRQNTKVRTHACVTQRVLSRLTPPMCNTVPGTAAPGDSKAGDHPFKGARGAAAAGCKAQGGRGKD
jgi:hypothetical protein